MTRRFVTGALLLAVAGGTTFIFAQTKGEKEKGEKQLAQAADAQPPAAEAQPPAADAQPPAGQDQPPADPYAVPEGTDTQALSMFLQRLARTPPPERTEEGILDHLTKMDAAVTEIMSREVEEELFASAAEIRFQILSLLPQFGDETAVARREKFLEELQQDERESIQRIASRIEMSSRIGAIGALSEEDRQKLIQDVAGKIDQASADEPEDFQMAIQMAVETASNLEGVGDFENAITAYSTFSEKLKAKDDERLERVVERWDATVRRLSLPGSTMEVTGTTLEGEKFDLDKHEGKVVLVDFWATWCGPCRAELPNLKRLYQAYHEKGFEVVGISLDEDREALKEFLEEENISWITLFEQEEEKQGWEHPTARRYGISAIPTAILVDQEGKVVSLMARGRELSTQLEKLLGPVEDEGSE